MPPGPGVSPADSGESGAVSPRAPARRPLRVVRRCLDRVLFLTRWWDVGSFLISGQILSTLSFSPNVGVVRSPARG